MNAVNAQAVAVQRPEILAPAGDVPSFLAALSAGADAIYLGLKHFSARMQADNFGLTELSRLVDLAHAEQVRVYVAMNTLVKPGETAQIYRLAARLASQVRPDGLIVQDLAFLDLARQAGFEQGLFLSTLANATHPAALSLALKMGANRVILPRELSIDEIRFMAAACPQGLDLECFVHGALCYCVSGRCYWSSYMGGKSGLRGRCVQPCRRLYRQGGRVGVELARSTAAHVARNGPERDRQGQRRDAGKVREHPLKVGKARDGRWFSCLDLSLDVLVKTLRNIPHLVSWKIEGRKKGPHYVYHVVTAYRMLRDNPGDAQARKMAEELLQMALGRATTKARFLPQREKLMPMATDGQTSSGLLAGKIRIEQSGVVTLKPFLELLPQDYLRVGVEDERWHTTLPVTRRVPKGGSLVLRLDRHKTPRAGTPVFLIDRREQELQKLIASWGKRLECLRGRPSRAVAGMPRMPRPVQSKPRADIFVRADLPQGKETRPARKRIQALWLSPKSVQISRTVAPRICWWLPPVVWPSAEEALGRQVRQLWKLGARHFVCNAPWQRAFFPDDDADMDILAGPFCNLANAAALGVLAGMGFAGAFISPELSREDVLALPQQSPLPLGMVLSGYWPVGISRFGLLGVKAEEPFLSPKGEPFWARQYGGNVWLYPAWPLDLTEKRQELVQAGYSFFAHMDEHPPTSVPQMQRKSLFNWEVPLL
ncbi:MAG: U32 family peptidase [Desulfovibrio sp.]|nr:U32 family peptidase [Desulfovibrio sp.]